MIENYLRYCGYVHPEELGEDGERVNKDFLMLFFSDTGLHILQQATDIFIGKLLYNLCAAKALFSCPAIISQRLEPRITSNEPLENTEEESKII